MLGPLTTAIHALTRIHLCSPDYTYTDLVLSTLFFQFCLYVCVRLARRGFTLGELGIVSHAGTGLFMEVINLTRSKVSQFHLYPLSRLTDVRTAFADINN